MKTQQRLAIAGQSGRNVSSASLLPWTLNIQLESVVCCSLAGPDVEKIFETIPDNGKEKDHVVAATKLTEYFAPKKNIMYEIHLFRKAQQRQGETIDQFYTRLCQNLPMKSMK